MAETTKTKVDPKVLEELVKGISSEEDLSTVLRQLSKRSDRASVIPE